VRLGYEAVRAIVTGGAGFIGSHLVDALLARGDEILVVDNLARGKREHVPPGVELVERDIREPLGDLFGRFRPDVCFHLAAQADVRVSVARPDEDATVNVIGTINALSAAQEHDTKIVFSSTGGAIYGECTRPAREDDPLQPISPYGTAKLAAEEYVSMWNRLHGAQHTILRYANVYGPRQDAELEGGVVAIFFDRFRNGGRATIFGDGKQTRDFLHVSDIVAATLAAVEVEGLFNVGSGRETSILELHELCRRASGTEGEPEHAPPRLGELERSVLDGGRAEDGLRWRPQLSLENGLRATWEWQD
jgi:UDP-glucose 4-epimerase